MCWVKLLPQAKKFKVPRLPIYMVYLLQHGGKLLENQYISVLRWAVIQGLISSHHFLHNRGAKYALGCLNPMPSSEEQKVDNEEKIPEVFLYLIKHKLYE